MGGGNPASPHRGDGAFHRLPVGGLVLALVGCDDIETWISQKLAGGRDVGSDPAQCGSTSLATHQAWSADQMNAGSDICSRG